MSGTAAAPKDTTDRTIERGAAREGGWRELQPGPGETYQKHVPSGEVLGCLWHLSDLHVCDAESPARLEYLDRYSDADSPYRQQLGDIGTYRPQEALTVQVATAMVHTVNARLTGPTTGAPIDIVLLTGDVTDNAQRNELQWYQGILAGGVITPRSGDRARSSWVGATDPLSWDERFWHPDGPPTGTEPDLPTRRFGYPTIPGLVVAARRDVHSPGLVLPWLTVHGNHDGLLQGTVAPDERLRDLATGEARITGLAPGQSPMITADAIAETGPAHYPQVDTSPRTPIPADPGRDFVEPGEFARATRPTGSEHNYFIADVGGLRVIALDTVNPHGGWQGSLDPAQFTWLTGQLEAAKDRYVLITSHHPSPTLTNDYAPGGAQSRILGPEVITTLLAHRNVIAWIAGHVHFHAAMWHGGEEHGFWEITTSSLIDWPQQGRILEFVKDTESGDIAIISTVVDHLAPATWNTEELNDPVNLAAISRALCANDYRLRDDSLRGLHLDSTPEVRNTVWRVPDPFVQRDR